MTEARQTDPTCSTRLQVVIVYTLNMTMRQLVREAVSYANLARDEGLLSSSGRVSTTGAVRSDASAAADAERSRALDAGTPYRGVVGHGPDTTWTGLPKSPFWQDLDRSINSSLGRQSLNYPIGFKPSRFIYFGDLP